MEYINEIQPALAKVSNVHYESMHIPQNNFSNLIQRGIVKKLQKRNSKAENVNHLQASVIVNWLGQFNIRKVQCLAGHRYNSSTYKYRQNNLESLHEAVNEFHPLY